MEENRNDISDFGHVSRMDNIQAAILNFRLKNLTQIIKQRRNNVNLYLDNLDRKKIFFPKEKFDEFNTYHTFVIQVEEREKLIKYLADNGVGTAIHYPIPIHLQKASKFLGYKKNDFPIAENQSKNFNSTNKSVFKKRRNLFYL